MIHGYTSFRPTFTAKPAANKVRQQVTKENTELTATDTEKKDVVRQKGARSADKLVATTGEKNAKGAERVRQQGRAGDDSLGVKTGHGPNRVTQNAGNGNDTITLDQGEGKTTGTVYGGQGNDSFNYTGQGPVIIRNGAGQIIFKQGETGFSTLRLSGVENFSVNGQTVATKLPPKGNKSMTAAFQNLQMANKQQNALVVEA